MRYRHSQSDNYIYLDGVVYLMETTDIKEGCLVRIDTPSASDMLDFDTSLLGKYGFVSNVHGDIEVARIDFVTDWKKTPYSVVERRLVPISALRFPRFKVNDYVTKSYNGNVGRVVDIDIMSGSFKYLVEMNNRNVSEWVVENDLLIAEQATKTKQKNIEWDIDADPYNVVVDGIKMNVVEASRRLTGAIAYSSSTDAGVFSIHGGFVTYMTPDGKRVLGRPTYRDIGQESPDSIARIIQSRIEWVRKLVHNPPNRKVVMVI